MKKELSILLLLLSISTVFGQNYNSKKKIKERKDDFSITIKDDEKNNIDWKILEDYFNDKKTNDSIQFSVKLLSPKNNEFNSEKKYTVKGLAKNYDELIKTMKNLLN